MKLMTLMAALLTSALLTFPTVTAASGAQLADLGRPASSAQA
jgi:hypothetical protein